VWGLNCTCIKWLSLYMCIPIAILSTWYWSYNHTGCIFWDFSLVKILLIACEPQCTLLSGWARQAFSSPQWAPSSKHTNTLYAWHITHSVWYVCQRKTKKAMNAWIWHNTTSNSIRWNKDRVASMEERAHTCCWASHHQNTQTQKD